MTAITRSPLNTDLMVEFTVNDLYLATVDDWSAIQFAASVGLLPNSRKCERCGRPMHLVSRQENIDKKRWICKISEGRKKRYCSTKSIRSGTFFEKSHLTIKTIVHIIYWWSLEVPPNLIEPLCSITSKAAADFALFLRQECEKYFLGHKLDWEEHNNNSVEVDTTDSSETSSSSSTQSRWAAAKRKQGPLESSAAGMLEKKFRIEANGAVFAKIIDAIKTSHNSSQFLLL
ncbi:unnamed protein product [Bursaphelenchus okinawaensis]|uniref:Uncharacterized protein n=1 Tax=Bursaphelenchus okinawaensis TaxID=465554 RepID=A0A811JS54_9BILA|nr:unnamed protein product [Bursaphelenchus okinawaensis]CAG9080418.1 unnamed protein product [Bursaphelenchus okinawaensis]